MKETKALTSSNGMNVCKNTNSTSTGARKSSGIQSRIIGSGMIVNRRINVKNTATTAGRMNTLLERSDINADNFKHTDEGKIKKNDPQILSLRALNFDNPRTEIPAIGNPQNHQNSRFTGIKSKNYTLSNSKEAAIENDYKSHCNIAGSAVPIKYENQSSAKIYPPVSQHSRPSSRSEATFIAASRITPEQQPNVVAKMTPMHFPPLRAPQSIVDIRHPFVTEARSKQSETGITSVKSKTDLNALQNCGKELNYTGHTYHRYGTSRIAGIPSIQNLGNVATNISPYVRSDSYGQPTVANVVYPETAQFPQSPPFNAPQVGQYQSYDHSSYATTPVNVNPVLTQYSGDNSLPYPQYENSPQFVQTNHYTTTDINNSQYQYQAAGVGQIPESTMFLQSLQSPIAVADQYTASNYARAVRTELIPRLHQQPRFNK